MLYKQLRPLKTKILLDYISILKQKFRFLFYKETSVNVLDICSGSGVFSYFIYKYINNINKIIMIEKNSCLSNKLEKYIVHKYGYNSNFKVICCDARNLRINIKFDIVIIDPPYKYNIAQKIIDNLIKNKILNNKCIVIIRSDKYSNKNDVDHPNLLLIHSLFSISESKFFIYYSILNQSLKKIFLIYFSNNKISY